MSWSTSFKFENGDLSEEDAKKLNELGPTLSTEAQEQASNAAIVAATFIDAGIVGDPAGSFQIILSGHANPGHKITPGWANDCVAIAIYQTGEPDEPDEDSGE